MITNHSNIRNDILKELEALQELCRKRECQSDNGKCKYVITYVNTCWTACALTHMEPDYLLDNSEISNTATLCSCHACSRACPLFNRTTKKCILRSQSPTGWDLEDIEQRLAVGKFGSYY